MSENRYRMFFRFVVPSVLSFALSGIYAIVDGFFVGNSIGDIGLSSINIAYPVVSFLQALGTGIGMGGAVMYSILAAEKRKKDAVGYARSVFTLLLAGGILCTAALRIFTEPVLIFLGAEGEIVTLGTEYLHIIISGGVLQIFATGVVPLIRNLGGASFSMVSMIAGFLTNIALDYLMVWVFEWGMSGAALATVIGQGVTMVLGLIYIWRKERELIGVTLKGIKKNAVRIIKIGIAPFGLTLSPMISLMFMNRSAMEYGGERAVACYACIAYATTICYLLLQGVGDGCQPLVSQYYGKKETHNWKFMRRLAYILSLLLAVISVAVLFAARLKIGGLFGASEEVNIMIAGCIYIFLIGILFLSFTRVTTSCFYATEKSIYSYILVYAEPALVFVLLLFVPEIAGIQGVWWSMGGAQVISAGIALVLKKRSD